MNERTRAWAKWLLWALPVWAALLFLGTLTHQPDPRSDFPAFAAYVTTISFLASHLVASILGAGIGSVGVVGLALYLQDTRTAGRSMVGMVLTVLGNTVTTAIFGVAAFGQTALGRAYLAGQQAAPALYNEIYSAPLFLTAIVGLLFFIAGGVLVGIAIAASGRLPRWAGWLYAITAVTFVLSNFLLPVAQAPSAALLFVAAAAVAWTASRSADGASAAASAD